MLIDIIVSRVYIYVLIGYSMFKFVINIQHFENLEIMEVDITSQNGQNRVRLKSNWLRFACARVL